MQTLREILSELITDAKGLTLDDRISNRLLASKFRSKLSYFLRLEAKSFEFAKLQNVWQTITCVQLQDATNNACGLIDDCKTLKRSVDTIPEAFGTNYGLLMKVLTVADGLEFKLLSNEGDSAVYTTRRWGSDRPLRKAYLENKHLYIPDIDVEAVKVILIPVDPFEVDKANGKLTPCSSPLDAEITYPDYLITLAKQETLKETSGVYKREVQDERPDDNTNQKQ